MPGSKASRDRLTLSRANAAVTEWKPVPRPGSEHPGPSGMTACAPRVGPRGPGGSTLVYDAVYAIAETPCAEKKIPLKI